MARIENTEPLDRPAAQRTGYETGSHTSTVVSRTDNSAMGWIIGILAALAVIAIVFAFSGSNTERALTPDPSVTTVPSTPPATNEAPSTTAPSTQAPAESAPTTTTPPAETAPSTTTPPAPSGSGTVQ